MKPLVSVIIPNYNHANYLEKRLDSVFSQTYDTFEVIILDDCSTDNSLEIINKYSDNPHISSIIVNNRNSGSTFRQWEKGIQLAKGDLMWIAESDDYNELTFLEEMVNAFKRNPQAVVAFSSYIVFNDYDVIKHKERTTLLFDGIRFIQGWMSLQNAIKNASGAVFKKSAYDLISKDYISFRGSGDYQFWIEIASKGKVLYVRKNLTYFRTNPNSVTANNEKTGNSIIEDIRICNYILQNFHLSWHQKQAMSAMHTQSGRTCTNPIIRAEMNAIWGSDNRNSALDNLFLRSISFLRKFFGILI